MAIWLFSIVSIFLGARAVTKTQNVMIVERSHQSFILSREKYRIERSNLSSGIEKGSIVIQNIMAACESVHGVSPDNEWLQTKPAFRAAYTFILDFCLINYSYGV